MIKYLIYIISVHAAQSFRSSFNISGGKTRRSTQRKSSRSSSETRAPWNLIRFVQQSSKFVSLPLPKLSKSEKKMIPGDTLWEAGSSTNFFTFGPLDDVVMGGASSSNFDEYTGIWKGTVTTANNGGFVGIRSTPFTNALDLSQCKGVEFKIKGPKGKKIKGMLRDNTEFNGPTWCTTFSIPNNGVLKVRLPFEKLVATKFARTIEGQVFQKDNVAGVQLVYSKFEYDGKLNPTFSVGDFSLQLISVEAY